MPSPTATHCRNGTPFNTIPLAVGPRDPEYFYSRQHELARKAVGMEPGSILVFGSSAMNFIPVCRFSPYAIDYSISGVDIRRFMHQMADAHDMGWYYNGAVQKTLPMPSLDCWDQAGGVIIYGLVHTHLNQEAQGGYTAAESVASAQMMFEKIAAYLTGPLVIFEGTPVNEATVSVGNTNAQIDAINAVMATIFGSRANTVLVQNAYKFKDANGKLDPAYELSGGLYLNSAGVDIIVEDGRAALTSLGIGE